MTEVDWGALHASHGRAYPLGAVVRSDGVRFSIVSRHATRAWLALFAGVDDAEPAVEFELDPARHRTGDVWTVYVRGIGPGALYTFRMDGPLAPERGYRIDPNCHLIDPYAKCVVGDIHLGRGKCVVIDEQQGWVPDLWLRTPMRDTVIYETHVRGFTMDESSGVEARGTYEGLVEKIPYLKDLGVTAVELLPVQEVGEYTIPRTNPDTGEVLTNYWGYSPINFFAPAQRYSFDSALGAQLDAFRRMVAALHAAGLEVILDVVFNHTAEGGVGGPTLSFRGLDDGVYYLQDDKGGYLNFSGCGNTLNCNHPRVRDLILDALRWWVGVMHVDGFRFDLASILGRDRKGEVVENAPVVERIAEDPVLRNAKLIAEAWDAGGAYQVGSFGDVRWAEWNGQYRDDVRRYWRGDAGMKSAFAKRITGSPDLYDNGGRSPLHSVNFVTAHDGFTLRDLVSYNEKHNEANGEANRDGSDANYGRNCGVEGDTDDAEVNALRLRVQKSHLATLFMSLGVPMLLGGDEFGRTQGGNNNAYCQDNAVSWYDWRLMERNAELFRFCREVIRFRAENPVFCRTTYFDGEPLRAGDAPDVLWYTPSGERELWENEAEAFAWWINGNENEGVSLYLLFNPDEKTRSFHLTRSGSWFMRINTAESSPRDIVEATEASAVDLSQSVEVAPKSLIVLAESLEVV
jgi:isoamylase